MREEALRVMTWQGRGGGMSRGLNDSNGCAVSGMWVTCGVDTVWAMRDNSATGCADILLGSAMDGRGTEAGGALEGVSGG